MRCQAHCSNGEPCRASAVRGATVCVAHGAAASQVRRAAKRRVAEAHAQKALVTYGHPIEVDPITALVGELQRTAGVLAWLHLLIEDLTPEVAAESAWVEVYRQERRHLVEVSATAIKSGIQERQVALAERQGALVVDLIVRLLHLQELRDDQRRLATAFVSRELRAVDAPCTPSVTEPVTDYRHNGG